MQTPSPVQENSGVALKVGQFVLGLVGSLAIIAGPLVLLKVTQFKAMGAAAAAMAFPPETVTATEAKSENWELSLTATGSVAAVQGVTASAEVAGRIVKVAFEAGNAVKAGDLLVQLDTSTEEAQLRAAEATAALAKLNLERARTLRQSNTNSPADLDAAEAQAKQADAQADGYRAVIAKKTIRAPFTGRLGLRLINLGQNLKDGDAIATLQTLDPIYVNFSLPQQQLAQIAPGSKVRVTSDVAPGQTFEGTINAISPEVDAATRNVRVEATIANSEEKLRTGMFAKVEVVLGAQKKVLAVPATSILYSPYGDSVFVVEEQKDEKGGQSAKVLRQQFVQLGDARGDFVDVVSGLKPGETVVTSGVFKLRSKEPVVIDNTLAPNAQLDPKPKDT